MLTSCRGPSTSGQFPRCFYLIGNRSPVPLTSHKECYKKSRPQIDCEAKTSTFPFQHRYQTYSCNGATWFRWKGCIWFLWIQHQQHSVGMHAISWDGQDGSTPSMAIGSCDGQSSGIQQIEVSVQFCLLLKRLNKLKVKSKTKSTFSPHYECAILRRCHPFTINGGTIKPSQ